MAYRPKVSYSLENDELDSFPSSCRISKRCDRIGGPTKSHLGDMTFAPEMKSEIGIMTWFL